MALTVDSARHANFSHIDVHPKPNTTKHTRFRLTIPQLHKESELAPQRSSLRCRPQVYTGALTGLLQHNAYRRGEANLNHVPLQRQPRLTGLTLIRESIEEVDEYLPPEISHENTSNNAVIEHRTISRQMSAPNSRQCLTTQQYNQMNSRGRLLSSIPTQSNFSLLLREAVRPTQSPSNPKSYHKNYSKSAKSYNSSMSAITRTKSAPANVSITNDRYKQVTPSLRMENEDSSFMQYVRMNRSSAQRLGVYDSVTLFSRW